jgi:D-lactate dehydrogenase
MQYDILFFEALGEENAHLREEIEKAKAKGTIPADLQYYIGTETLQEFLCANPSAILPNIISTKTHSILPEEWLNSGKKKCVISRSAGYDHFEHLAKIANITSLREYCVNAVAETAIKLMFCTCGNLNQYTQNMTTFERNNNISFKELTGLKVTVFGVGKIGKRIYDMAKGVGTNVRAVDLRADTLSALYNNEVRFISKEEATDSDVIICAMNYTKDPASRYYNKAYFTEEYLRSFPKGCVFINVTRGEIAPEAALWKLYAEGHLFGIGVDTFNSEAELTRVLRGYKNIESEHEDAAIKMIDAALVRTANIYVQPHQGFNSDVAALCKAKETVKHIEDYFSRGCTDFKSQLPYYL